MAEPWSVLVLPAVLILTATVAAGLDAVRAAAARGPAGSTGEILVRAGQPVRAGLRDLTRPPRRVSTADAFLGRVAVTLLPTAAVLAGVVLPLGFTSVSDLGVGVVWFNAMEALAWAAVWLAGWAPDSALSLIGGYRFLAQGLAYELPHMLALTTAALSAQSLRVGAIVDAQAGLWNAVWMPAAFVVYLISAMAMAFWGPFDHPVAPDLAGGVMAELSGPDRLVFAAGRWLLLVVAAGLAVPLFLGGGHGPLLPGWVWTVLKTAAVLAALVLVRRALPTVRMDRYARLSWVVLLPVTLAQALVVAVVVLAR